MRYDLMDEDYAKAEREAMRRPSNSAMWDDRLYTTHAPVMAWAERGDDLLSESNYLMALDLLGGVITEDRQDCEDVIDATISDWLVGSLRQIFVRVREEVCEHCGLAQNEQGEWDSLDTDDGHWHGGTFTPAWREAVRIAHELEDYPVLDENDFSERECEEFDRQLEEALGDAQNHYENLQYERGNQTDASLDLHERVLAVLYDIQANGSGFEFGERPNVYYDWVRDAYVKAADAITFGDWEEYARNYLICQGQTVLL